MRKLRPVMPFWPQSARTVVDVVDVVELVDEELVDDVDEPACCALWAPASGASRASIAVAADDKPNVALSDHTTVRTNFWAI